MSDFSHQAVQAALKQDWERAVDLNLSALDGNPSDTDALNRLGFAYLQLGKITKARTTYEQALKLNPYSAIAKKSLYRINLISQKKAKFDPGTPTSSKISFLEEPGKTKAVTLVRPADSQVIASLNSGIPVNLLPKSRRISVQTLPGTYLGSLPDDIAFKIGRLLKLGYKYQSFVKTTGQNTITIFIRETLRSKRGRFLPSFPAPGTGKSANIPKGNIYDAPIDVTPTGEEDDLE